MIPRVESSPRKGREALGWRRTRPPEQEMRYRCRGNDWGIRREGKKWEVRASKGFEATKRCFRTKRGNRMKVQGLTITAGAGKGSQGGTLTERKGFGGVELLV